LIAYQIVIKGNANSEKYAEISRKSFQPAIDAGVISEIRTFNAITPESPDFEEICAKYNWAPSLMIADLSKNKDDHSPTEKAGMCSHWELMRIQSESMSRSERFLILEHDTYLLEEHIDTFCTLINYIHDYLPIYANIGMFMGCYTLDQPAAAFCYDLLTKRNFPINCGPYCTLQRLYRTYSTKVLEKPEINFFGKDVTVIHPWTQCTTLGFGRECGVYFNKKDPSPQTSVPNPTTQVISRSMMVTQDHHGYIDKHIEQPWLRHKYFKEIE
tara:strand:- start:33826 stop:34638 length:813 start_codon:yes stop_codon:yes gene_type:complete